MNQIARVLKLLNRDNSDICRSSFQKENQLWVPDGFTMLVKQCRAEDILDPSEPKNPKISQYLVFRFAVKKIRVVVRQNKSSQVDETTRGLPLLGANKHKNSIH